MGDDQRDRIMRIDIRGSDNLLIRHGKDIEMILQRSVLKALQEHKRAGNPVAVWQDGGVILIDPADIPGIDDDQIAMP